MRKLANIALSCVLSLMWLGNAAAPAHAVADLAVTFTTNSSLTPQVLTWTAAGSKTLQFTNNTGADLIRFGHMSNNVLAGTVLPVVTAGTEGTSCGLLVSGTTENFTLANGSSCTLTFTWDGTGTVNGSIYVGSGGTNVPFGFSSGAPNNGGPIGGADAGTMSWDATTSTLSWQNTVGSVPLTFCTQGQTYSQCNPPTGMLFYYPLANQSSIVLTAGMTVQKFNGTGSTDMSLPEGSYTVFIRSGSSVDLTIGGGAPAAPAIAIFPAINASGVPTVSGAVVGSTAKCVAPTYDLTPTDVQLILSVDGVVVKEATLTKAPFEVSTAIPANSAGKTIACAATARVAGGSSTNASETVIKAASTTVTPVAPTTPTTPVTCSGTKVIGFGNAATAVSPNGSSAVRAFAGSACKFTVTGYSQPSSSRASSLAMARAKAVAAEIRRANPGAVITVVNGGKTKNAACTNVANRCVVVSRG